MSMPTKCRNSAYHPIFKLFLGDMIRALRAVLLTTVNYALMHIEEDCDGR